MNLRRQRSAFTLLEILLALGLTVIVLGIIFSAIYQYLLVLTRQQAEIERKQVARGVVRMINDDLTGAIQYKPEDYSALENLISSQSLSGLTGMGDVDTGDLDPDQLEDMIVNEVVNGGTGSNAAQSAGSGAPGTGNAGPDGNAAQEEEEQEEEVEEVGRPTLIGNDKLLRIDTSRLPRLDEYNPLVARRAIDQQLPADVKTVTYFFSDTPPVVEDKFMPLAGRQGGLYRRRIDRAVEAFSGDENVSDRPDEFCELIAPEVTNIKFRYFDGTDWQEQWNSAEMNGFPAAIEVVVAMDPLRGLDPRQQQQVSNPEDLEELRTVVYLPVAEILPEEVEETEGEEGSEGR